MMPQNAVNIQRVKRNVRVYTYEEIIDFMSEYPLNCRRDMKNKLNSQASYSVYSFLISFCLLMFICSLGWLFAFSHSHQPY